MGGFGPLCTSWYSPDHLKDATPTLDEDEGRYDSMDQGWRMENLLSVRSPEAVAEGSSRAAAVGAALSLLSPNRFWSLLNSCTIFEDRMDSVRWV